MTKNMDEMSTADLKVMAYDILRDIEKLSSSLRAINDKIAAKEKDASSSPTPK